MSEEEEGELNEPTAVQVPSGRRSEFPAPRLRAPEPSELAEAEEGNTRIDPRPLPPASAPPPPLDDSGPPPSSEVTPLPADVSDATGNFPPEPDGAEAPSQGEFAVVDHTIRQSSVDHTTYQGADLTPITLGTGANSTIMSHDALVAERRAQARNGLLATMILSGLGAVALQFSQFRGVPTHWYATGALIFLSLVSVFGLVRLRGGAEITSLSLGAVGFGSTLVTLALVAHVGPFTPVSVFLPVIVYYFATTDMPRRAVAMLATAAGGYALIVYLSLTGVLSLMATTVPMPVENPRPLMILGVVVVITLVGTFFLGRAQRRSTLLAMEQLESARREIRQREALLEEARQDLDRALDLGKVGRLTGSDVGPYVAQEVIGRGGMGEVYRAVARDGGEEVALKVLHPQLREDADHVARFFNEAKISSDLASPHIVDVLGTGHAPDGSPYLAMELLTGESLGQLLRRHGRLKLKETLTMVSQVAQALTMAQEAGIVHRDLKPQNLFRTAAGVWKVLDFGVSKIASASVTMTHGEIVGTPSYMSPEQARGEPVDHRSDVFSLGSIAYRTLTGRPAFYAPDPIAVLYNVMESMPVKPGELARLDADVDLALTLALAKDRERRLRSATSFAAALHDASRGELDDRLREAAQALLAQLPWAHEELEDLPISRR